jgi:flagellar biosynthesis/type III secretory pathway M-ring protein FliF/YscJ
VLANLPPALPQLARRCAQWLRPRKIQAAVVGCALVVTALLVAFASRMGAQTALFGSTLHQSQTAEVERVLTIWNEPFSVDPAHTQIFVPSGRRRDVLLRLTLAGLPHRYVPTTSDVLEQPANVFAPQTVMDDRRRAGIEGDLVAGLRRINGVADAMVVIAPAQDDPLASDAGAKASASVQLVMQAGATLSPTAVSGIKHFVAASYPGLNADRVIVVDGFGVAAGAQTAPDKAASRESRLQASIQTALDAVFGMGAAIVRVSVRNAGEDRSAQSTRVTPHGLLEADSGKERGSDNGKRFERERNHTRYAYDTLVETRSAHADALARIAVAVFLDARKISLDQTKLVADLVRAAAGADLSSGDQVVVQALPFRDAALAAAPARGVAAPKVLALSLALIAAVVLGVLWIRHHTGGPSRGQDDAAVAVHATLEHELPQTAAYVLRAMPQRVRDQVLREYSVDQRERIIAYLNGRTHGPA